MKSYLHQLENNEAILLMYLADELPPQDRVDVEQMLASDAGMRAELKALRELHEAGMAAMAEMDDSAKMPISEAVAARQVMRMIYKRQAESRRIVPEPVEPGRSFPWWRYSIGAAAVLLIGLLTWWGFRPPSDPSHSQSDPDGIVQNDNPGFRRFPGNWMAEGPHELNYYEKMAMLRNSILTSTDDDSGNMQLAAAASKTSDTDINSDLIGSNP